MSCTCTVFTDRSDVGPDGTYLTADCPKPSFGGSPKYKHWVVTIK